MTVIDMALKLAVIAHEGQVDKSGQPFIMHPIRVSSNLHPLSEQEIIAAALLHDVVEDTPITLEDLELGGYPALTIELVDYMTRRQDESYKDYIHRIGTNPLACELKLADLRDNMDDRRATTPAIRGMIHKRYIWSKEYLEERRAIRT